MKFLLNPSRKSRHLSKNTKVSLTIREIMLPSCACTFLSFFFLRCMRVHGEQREKRQSSTFFTDVFHVPTVQIKVNFNFRASPFTWH